MTVQFDDGGVLLVIVLRIGLGWFLDANSIAVTTDVAVTGRRRLLNHRRRGRTNSRNRSRRGLLLRKDGVVRRQCPIDNLIFAVPFGEPVVTFLEVATVELHHHSESAI